MSGTPVGRSGLMNPRTERFLAEVLAPVDLETFFDSHWERRPLHLARAGDARFAALVDRSAIERLLATADLRFPDVQLVRSRAPIEQNAYTDEELRVVPRRLAEHYRDGATLVIGAAHRRFESLAELVRDAQAALGLRCQANLYLSPPGRQGFNPHYDSHDVIVLQLNGRKTFHFYTVGVDRPFAFERFEPGMDVGGARQGSVTLDAGDTLYVPRGITHDAVADETAASMHVTLGVAAVTMRDLALEALTVAVERDRAWRASVPWRHWRGGGVDAVGSTVRPTLRALFDALDEDTVTEALSRLRDAVTIDATEDALGLLALDRASQPTPDTVLEIREQALDVERRSGHLKLRGTARVMTFEPPYIEAVEYLIDAQRSRVSDLPGLDAEQRTTLVRRLIEERFVAVVSGRC